MRVFVDRIVSHHIFETSIVALIVYGSVLLTLDDANVTDGSHLRAFLDINDVVLTVLFATEMGVKMLAYGLFLHPGSYLRSSWN